MERNHQNIEIPEILQNSNPRVLTETPAAPSSVMRRAFLRCWIYTVICDKRGSNQLEGQYDTFLRYALKFRL
jgi:hypothetical protein